MNLIKEKRCGKTKGSTCADGSNQELYLKEGDIVLSPMVSLEALLYTLITDAHEGRGVATFDVTSAYLHAEIPKDKKNLMKIRGDLVNIMCQVNSD